MQKKSISFYFFVLTFCFISASCGREYTTPIPADPLYKSHPKNIEKLGEPAENYVKRDSIDLESTGNYAPKENESFSDYKLRLFNTLVLQQQDNQQQQHAIVQKEAVLADLREQLQLLQKRHLDLRLALAAQTPEQNKHAIADALFMRYTIESGDTLQKIAYDKLDSNKAWIGIYRFNVEKLSNGPNRIRSNDWIIIPKINVENSIKLHEQNRTQN